MVSILIAARNEEKNIIACLEAIYRQRSSKPYEVWIGNDQSEDQTAAVVEKFIRDKPNFHLLPITQSLGLARGKANVLAQLARQAEGNYFLITDADIEVPPTWLASMVMACDKNVGIINGVTVIRGKSWLAQLQALEWVYTLGVMHWFADRKVPITAMGNNMLVTREAYFATGGYENLPFSVTEDYQLFREVLRNGYSFRQLFDSSVLAYSQPADSFAQVLQQRKRWMVGAMQLPLGLRLLLILGALFVPFLLMLAFYIPQWAALFFLLQSAAIVLSLIRSLRRLGLFHRQKWVWVYPFYHFGVLLATLFYYLLPGTIQWKGRRYGRY